MQMQKGALFLPMPPLVQEYHEGRPRFLWSFQLNTFVDTWELGVPEERGPSRDVVDTTGWGQERMSRAGV